MRSFVPFALIVSLFATAPSSAIAPGVVAPTAWAWPVVGPVIQAFDPPEDPYGSGHRGIDIAAPVETSIVAPADGVVSFAGPVGGRLFLTIDHGGGLRSTYSWLTSVLVHTGNVVVRGQPIALTGWGHPNAPIPHLHFGVKLNDVYVDPLVYLEPAPIGGLIRLAPLA